jgi:hypothetical protein
MPVSKPTARRLFERVAHDSPTIDRPMVVAYLKKLGLGSGLLGSHKLNKGADAFMARLDSAPKDGKVSWGEFVANSRYFLPPALTDANGRLNPALIPEVFAEIAGPGATSANKAKLASYVEGKVTGAAALFARTIAEASANLALDALDADGDGSITKTDLEDLVADINLAIDAIPV